jgi:hypothetical protein
MKKRKLCFGLFSFCSILRAGFFALDLSYSFLRLCFIAIISSCTLRILKSSAEAESVGVFAERGDAEGDVLLQWNAQFRCAVAHVVAADAFGE